MPYLKPGYFVSDIFCHYACTNLILVTFQILEYESLWFVRFYDFLTSTVLYSFILRRRKLFDSLVKFLDFYVKCNANREKLHYILSKLVTCRQLTNRGMYCRQQKFTANLFFVVWAIWFNKSVYWVDAILANAYCLWCFFIVLMNRKINL